MTVIAWDGEVMAADKQGTCGNGFRITTKLHHVPQGICGMAGEFWHGLEMLAWFDGGMDPSAFPKCSGDDGDGSHIMLVTHDKQIITFHAKCRGYGEILEDKMLATGSGGEYAMAALYLGYSAVEAVEVACALDPNCGAGVDTIRLKKKWRKK